MLDIANEYEINLVNINLQFRSTEKHLVSEHWKSSIADIASNPILCTYELIKTNFKFESYLDVVVIYTHWYNCELVPIL